MHNHERNKIMQTRCSVLGVSILMTATSLAYVNDAEKAVVGTRETMTVEVASDETWDKPVFVQGVFRKTGAGKLTLLAEKLYGAGRIDVAEGELEITATGAGSAAFEEPTSVMSGAAMWLDASMHVAGADGSAASGDAVAWYDVRETDWTAPGFMPNYIYARANNNLAVGWLWPQIGTDASSRPYVDFGGVSSGQYMAWLTPSGAKAWIPVAHSFVVYSPNGGHGHVLGVATSPSSDGTKVMYFATSGSSDGTTLFNSQPASDLHHLRLGRVFCDGIQVDSGTAIDKSATQLIETEAYRPDAKAEAFFNFRNYQQSAGSGSVGDRVGGGRLHEVLIFTNKLSEAERILVEQHLLRKWVKTSGYSIPSEITVASGATLTLADAVAALARVKSEGTLRRPGAVVSTCGAIDPFAVSGRLDLDAGATVSNRAAVTISAQAGKTYAVDEWNTLTIADGEVGRTDKTGAGALAIDGFGSTTNFTVSEGVVAVCATTGITHRVSGNCIADGGFEGIHAGPSVTYDDGQQIGSSAWYVTNFCSSASTRVVKSSGWPYMWASGKVLGASEGDYYLLLKQGSGVRQNFAIEKAGRYEIKLRCYPRSSANYYAAFARVYVDGHPIGTVQCRPDENEWDAARLITHYLVPGDHVLALMSEMTTDNAIGIDDVRVALIDEEEDLFAVANGNFEDIDWAVAPSQPGANANAGYAIGYAIYGNSVSSRIMSTAYLKGWSVSGTAYLLRRLPYLRSSSEFIGPDNDNGCVSIALTNGTVLSQSVTIPAAGLYRLHAKAARYKHPTAQEYVGAPTDNNSCKMSLAVGGRSEEFTIAGWMLADFVLTHAVRLSKGDVVTLSVTSSDTVGKGNAIVVDDVRLVRECNMVYNGGFEEGSNSASVPPTGWTVVANPNNKQMRYSGYNADFGAGPVEGGARCRIHAGTHIAQTIPLSAGYYWLSFWNVSRSKFNSSDEAFKVSYGPAAIKVTLASGSVTNFCENVVPSSNSVAFIRRAYLVKVESAGDWTLGFEGEASSADISSFLDAVSLMPAPDVEAGVAPIAAKDMELSVGAAASLQLDYDGILNVGRFHCGTRTYLNEQSAETLPNLHGIGRVYSRSRAFFIVIR